MPGRTVESEEVPHPRQRMSNRLAHASASDTVAQKKPFAKGSFAKVQPGSMLKLSKCDRDVEMASDKTWVQNYEFGISA